MAFKPRYDGENIYSPNPLAKSFSVESGNSNIEKNLYKKTVKMIMTMVYQMMMK